MKYLRPKIFFALALTLSICASATAQDEAKNKTVDATEEISSIKSSLREQISELTKEYHTADDAESREAVVAKRRAMEADSVDRLITLVQKRDDDRRNIRDLVWFINRIKGEPRTRIYSELVPKHIKSKYMSELVRAVGKVSSPSPENEAWLRELIEKSPIDNVKGNATWTLVEYLEKLQLESDGLRSFGKDPLALFEEKDGDVVPTGLGEELTESRLAKYKSLWRSLKGRDEGALNDEIESLLTACSEKYADVKKGRKKIGAMATAKLNLSNLKVGKVAPDIAGVDLDGVDFKLSDYRGKVVMIDFWGDW